MTFNPQDMTNLLPIIAQFAQIPVEKWGENLEPQSYTILKVGDALVSAWENKTLAESDYPTARQFLYDCSHFLAHRPEHHRSNWLEMGVAIAQDDEARAWFLACLGGLNTHRGEYRKALGYYSDALTIYHTQNNKSREGRMLLGIGGAWSMLDEPQKALGYHQQALTLLEQTDNKKYQIVAFNELAIVWLLLNKRETALSLIQKALDMSHEIGDIEGQATSLNNLALMQPHALAMTYFEQALALHRRLGHKPCEGVGLANIASVFSKQSLPLKGIPYAEESLKIAQLLQNKRSQADRLALLGQFQKQLGKQAEAMAYFEQSFALALESNSKMSQINTILLIGELHERFHNPKERVQMFEQASVIAHNSEYRHIEFNIQSNLCAFYLKNTPDLPKALAIAQSLIPMAEEIGKADMMAVAYGLCANVLSRMGKDRLDEAILYAEKSFDILAKNNLAQDSGGGKIRDYQRRVKALYGRRDGWFYKLFPFLL